MMLNKNLSDYYRMRVKDTKQTVSYYPLPSGHVTGDQIEMINQEFKNIFTIEIFENDLYRLMDDLEQFHKARNPYDRQDMEQNEIFFRRTNPAVNKAWKNYKMLLKLVANGPVYD